MIRIWKKSLSVVLVLLMLVGMLPTGVFAADEVAYEIGDTMTTPNKPDKQPTAPEGFVWVLDKGTVLDPNPALDCGYSYEHTHDDSCYEKNCKHHDANCYNTTYAKCDCETTGNTHTGSVTLSNVLTYEITYTTLWGSQIPSGIDIQWVQDHPAYDVVYAEYVALGGNEGTAEKIGAVTKLFNVAFCYTTDSEPSCGHTCSAIGGSCYKLNTSCGVKTLGKYEEHTHVETADAATSCYVYSWTLYADTNGNGVGDGTADDPYYTVIYTDGVEGEEIFADQTHSNVLKSREGELSIPAYNGMVSRPGYTYTWAETVSDDGLTITRTATWAQIDYTITWDNGDGTWTDGSADVVKPQTNHYGDTLTAPAVAAPEDHYFSGWSPEVDTVTQSVTYTAQYTKDTIYTVTYTVDGAVYGAVHYVNVTDGERVPAVDAPEKDGYLFTGWTNATVIGQVPTGNVVLEAILVADSNRNGIADADETVTVSLAVSAGGTASLHNGGNAKILITAAGSDTYTVVYDSAEGAVNGDVIHVTATAADGETANVAYYLSRIDVNGEDKTATKSFKAGQATVTVTFTKETFILPAGDYAIAVNGFSKETKAIDLKKLVLDAIFGADQYTAADYRVSLKTGLSIGDVTILEDYRNVEGDTAAGLSISPEAIALSLNIGTTEDFRITKVNTVSGKELYNDVPIAVCEARKEITADAVTLSEDAYTENTLSDMIAQIKNNVRVNGKAVDTEDITVVLAPETALSTTKTGYTASITLADTADYLGNKTAFTFSVYGTVRTYTVTWKVDGVETKETYAYGAPVSVPADPAKEGHAFAGWTPSVVTNMGGADVTYTAAWNVLSYDIDWVVDGETVKSETLDYGTAIVAPAAPEKTGYTFTGWDVSVPATMPAQDLTVKATFAANLYTVTWNWMSADGPQTDSYQQAYGTEIGNKTVPAFYDAEERGETVRYYFRGWDGLADGATVPVGGVTYTAVYDPIPVYTVTFDVSGGTGVATQYIEAGRTAVQPTTTREGYGLIGWYLDGTLYDFATPVTADITLVADWAIYVAQVGDVCYISLGEAVEAANAAADGATVTLLQNITLGQKLTISGDVTLSGAHTITRADDYTGTLFAVDKDASLTLDGGLVIDGGNDYAFDDALYAVDLADWNTAVSKADSAKWLTPEEGAPVAAAFMITTTGGTVNLNRVTIRNNYSIGSGIVSAGANSTVTLTGATITHCASTQGNGLAVNASGAGISVTMNEGTTIDDNHVGGNHGVFKVYSGTVFTMNGGEIKNTTGWNSNGVAVGMYHATFIMNGGLICSNSSVYGPNNGRNAAIYTHSTSTFTMNGGTICHNTGRAYGGVDAPYTAEGYGSYVYLNGGSVVNNESIGGWANADVNGSDNLVINGGTYTQDVSQWCADGFEAFEIEDGVWGVLTEVYNQVTVTDNSDAVSGTTTVTGTPVDGYENLYNGRVTITAAPSIVDGGSVSYVSSLTVNGVEQELVYDDNYAVSVTVTESSRVVVTYTAVPVRKDESDVVDYWYGQSRIPYEEIYGAVVTAPGYDADRVTIEYFARGEMNVTVSLDSLDLDSSVKTLLSTLGITAFTFTLDELWMGLNETVTESVSLDTAVSTYLTKERINGLYVIYQAAYDAYLAEHGEGVLGANKVLAAVAGANAVRDDVAAIYDAVYAAAMYYGAHNFGYNATGAQTVAETIRIRYDADSMYWTVKTDVTLRDPREASFIGGSDLELTYKDYTDEELLSRFHVLDADGHEIDGAVVYAVELTDPYTYEGKNVSDTAYELIVKFAGNEAYKPAEATFHVTIVKADASLDLPNITTTWGEGYDPTPEVTHGNQYGTADEILDSLIEIIIGLDVADLKIAADGTVSGAAAHIQILLPEDETIAGLFDMIGLDVYGEGVSLSLTELQEYLGKAGDLLEGFDAGNRIMGALDSVLTSVTGLVDLSHVQVTFGGGYPTDIGVYLYGAVSTSGNYKTVYDMAYLVILPDTTEVYLDWNYADENGVFTWQLLQHIDMGASAYNDAAHTERNEEATGKVLNLYLGMDENGEAVLVRDASKLGNGAYTQLSFIADFGNELFYAAPLFRAFVIVPNVLEVGIKTEGQVTDHTTVPFDNAPVDVQLNVDFSDLVIKEGWTVDTAWHYYGVQTNTHTYSSDVAPTHSGLYLITATVIVRDENGEMIAVGADVATLMIKPVPSSMTVTGGTVKYDGKGHTVTVEAGSAVEGLKPDYTLISGTANVSGSLSEVGVDAFYGNINIDFPQWLDEILSDTEAFKEGVTPAYLIDFITSYREDLIAKIPVDRLIGMGMADADMDAVVARVSGTIDEVLSILKKMPAEVTLTFANNVAYAMPGYYLYYGIVTDSDHTPSADTGLLVIEKLDMEFHLENTTLPYNGKEQFANTYNPLGTDYLAVITDDKNNVANILLDADMMYVVERLEEILGEEIPTAVSIGDVYEAVKVADLASAIQELLSEIEAAADLSGMAAELIRWIKDQLETLPSDGEVVVNGALPTHVGEYKIYALTYSDLYKSVADGAVLTIAPIYVVIDDEQNSKIYGEADPVLTADVTYYSYQTVDGAVIRVTCTELPDDITVDYDVVREAGQAVGEYAMRVENVTITGPDYYIPEVVDDDTLFTILPAGLTSVAVEGEYTYDGEEQTAKIVVRSGNTALTEGVDYAIVSGGAGKNAGSYTVVVKGIGNYTGTLQASWNIAKKAVTITANNKTMVAGDALPTLDATVDAAVDGETLLYTVSTGYVSASGAVGIFPITVTPGENPNYDVTVCSGRLTVIREAVAYNTRTGEIYDDVSDALAATPAGDTLKLLKSDLYEAILLVPAAVTFDLNGHCIEAGNVLSLGHVIDSTAGGDDRGGFVDAEETDLMDGLGGIKITNDRTKAFVQLQQNNAYLPLYDAENGCYRFYAYTLSVLTHQTPAEHAVKFRLRLRLSDAEAYRLLADAENAGVELSFNVTWTGLDADRVTYFVTAELLSEYATAAYEQVVSGEKAAMKIDQIIYLTLAGVDVLGSGTVLTTNPVVSTQTGVHYEKVVAADLAGSYTTYTIS